MNLLELQDEIAAWHSEIFPGASTTRVVLKVLEEAGELAEAENRMVDAVGADRNAWKHKRIDAIGDIVICLAVLAEKCNVDLETTVLNVWAEVKVRPAFRVINGRAQ